MHVTLIQPRYPWGKHIYLPNGLLSIATQIHYSGSSAGIRDENIESLADMRPELTRADCIGIGVVGAPYAPEALRVATTLRRQGYTQPIVFGGQFVNRLTAEEAGLLFGCVSNASTTLPIEMYRKAEDSSMMPALESLPEYMKRAYFTREWCLFTSQGCCFNCNFCAAEKGVKERFREREMWENETACLADLVRHYAGERPSYDVYLSSLDACQTPHEMDRALRTVFSNFRRAGVQLSMRCLATAKCTVMAMQHDTEVLKRWRGYGLNCLAIGVDGNDPAVWRRENKRHNTKSDIALALTAIQDAGIQPEALMIIGFPTDSPQAIIKGAQACLRFTYEGIRARPYLGKAHAPGTKGWKEDRSVVEKLLANPEAMRELDYGGLGSPLTHPNWRLRWLGNASYLSTVAVLKVISPYGCPTQPLLPTETIARPLRPFARIWNRLMPADK